MVAIRTNRTAPTIDTLDVSAYVVPTDRPESDGTLAWDATTFVVVEARAGRAWGLGYGYADLATAKLIDFYFRRMLEAGAVDVLQADATRCAGITGFLRVATLCEAAGVPLSAHTAPSLHVHPCCAASPVRHVEYFHDHVRIEQMFFDGASRAEGGMLRPDLSRPGLGLEFRRADARRYMSS